MIRQFIITALIFATISVSGFEKQDLKTDIQKVKIYPEGAVIERTGTVFLNDSYYTLECKGFPVILDSKSLLINIDNSYPAKILDYNFKNDDSESPLEILENEKIRKYENKMSIVKGRLEKAQKANEYYSGLKSGINSAVSNIYNQAGKNEIKNLEEMIFNGEKRCMEDINSYNDSIKIFNDSLESSKKLISAIKVIPKQSLIINLKNERAGSLRFGLRYFIKNTGWYPFYNIKFSSKNDKSEIDMLASIYQETGEDWNDVKITVSNEIPAKPDDTPSLSPVYLATKMDVDIGSSYYKKIYDKDGIRRFVIEEFDIGEENKTFDLKNRYTVKSKDRNLKVKLDTKSLKSKYAEFLNIQSGNEVLHEAVIFNNSTRNFKNGNTNLFLDGEFKGKEPFKSLIVDDSASFNLGKDNTVSVNKRKIDDRKKEARLFDDIEEITESFEITVYNNNKNEKTVNLVDYIPFSIQEDIKISVNEEGWKHNTSNGKVVYTITLKPDEMKKVALSYKIRYPQKYKGKY